MNQTLLISWKLPEATDFECLEDGMQNDVVKYRANNDNYLDLKGC